MLLTLAIAVASGTIMSENGGREQSQWLRYERQTLMDLRTVSLGNRMADGLEWLANATEILEDTNSSRYVPKRKRGKRAGIRVRTRLRGRKEGRKEGTCLFDINIKHNTEIFIGKIISGDSH